jgi:hypothetical protein
MKQDRTKMLVLSLVLVIVVLLGFVMYSFVIRPSITGFAMNAYNGGVQDAVTSIMQQASQCNPVPLTSGETIMNMIWIDCLQQQPPQ